MTDNEYDTDEKFDQKQDQSTRARNRTVMLTPEITGQVRAKLNQNAAQTMTPYTPQDVAATIPPQSVASSPGFYSQVVQPSVQEAERPVAPRSAVVQELPRRETPTETPRPIQAVVHAAPAPTPVRQSSAGLNDLGIWVNEAPLTGFLVSFDRNPLGEVCTLRNGRMIVTSAPQSTGNYLFLDEPTVSPLHAIMRVTGSGEIQILDQLSETGTFIRRFGSEEEIELSGEKSFLEHGDTVRFGERTFHVTVIVRSEG